MLTLKFISKVNTEAENTVVVAMAEEAAAIDNNIGRDYWIGGVRTENGTWMWRSGDPMDYTNWCKNCPDVENYALSQLGKGIYAGILDTFYWARSTEGDGDNAMICEINMDK